MFTPRFANHFVRLLLVSLTSFVARPAHAQLLGDPAPNNTNFSTPWLLGQSPAGKILCMGLSADGSRVYAGSYSGLWRTDDGGAHWTQLTRPQPEVGAAVSGALLAHDVWSVAVSPQSPDIVMVYTAGNARVTNGTGIYRSIDGGVTWSVKDTSSCAKDLAGEIAFAPDNSSLVFAANGCEILKSTNAGLSWSTRSTVPNSGRAWHIAIGPAEGATRRVYAAGDNRLFYSPDAGVTWTEDLAASSILSRAAGFGFSSANCCYNTSNVGTPMLAVEPGHPDHLYLAAQQGANGPSYYANSSCGKTDGDVLDGARCNQARGCGEGSLWLGDYSLFTATSRALWVPQPGPPVYWGVTSPSGASTVVTTPLANGHYFVFFADESHVHMCLDRPTPGYWHRLDGQDIAVTQPGPNYCNKLLVHVDPHAIAVTSNFQVTLAKPEFIPAPYDSSTTVASYSAGTAWMANDGGIFRSTDGTQTWQNAAGGPPHVGFQSLATLQVSNIAGARMGAQPGAALYFGTGDNDDFQSLDAGESWGSPRGACGDCSLWWSDPGSPTRAVTVPRGGSAFELHTSTNAASYPDASDPPGTQYVAMILPPEGLPVSLGVAGSIPIAPGLRPVIHSLPGEIPPPDGDYVFIRNLTGTRIVYRALNSASGLDCASLPHGCDPDWPEYAPRQARWNQPAYVFAQCTSLPAGYAFNLVQAAGGHTDPMYFAGEPGGTVWKSKNLSPSWTRIVGPGLGATTAHRFFVDPYDANVIYEVDNDYIKRSDDGGASWHVDANLDNLATEGGAFLRAATGTFPVRDVLSDVQFSHANPIQRFAVGSAGVFYTLDGVNWTRLLSTTAMPAHPVSAWFDDVARDLYVAFDGRSVLKIAAIPSVPTPQASVCWLAEGTPVCAAAGAQSTPRMAPDATGGAFVTWNDARSGPSDVYLQRIGADGFVAAGWPTLGFAIAAIDSIQTQAAVCPDNSGGAFVAWADKRSGNYDIYLQRVTSSGALASGWPANGIVACTAAGDQVMPAISADGAGGALLSWTDHRGSSNDLYSLRITAAGTVSPGWTPNGVAVCTAAGDQGSPVAVVQAADGAGGIVVAWQDARLGISNWDIFAQRIAGSGAVQWAMDGVAVCAATGNQLDVAIVADGAGGAIVAWDDARAGTTDIYAQRLTSLGAAAGGWTTGGSGVCLATGAQSQPALVADGQGGAVMVWNDARSGHAVYGQKALGTGGMAWAADGVPLTQLNGTTAGLAVAADGWGGIYAAWGDTRNGTSDIYAQHLNGVGSAASGWPAQGLAVSTAVGVQRFPVLCAVSGNRAIAAWQDRRNGTDDDIYAQEIGCGTGSSSTLAVPPAPVMSEVLSMAAPWPNPAQDRVSFRFSIPYAARVSVDIFDIAGRRVRALVADQAMSAGAHTLEWDGRDGAGRALGGGTVFARVRAGGELVARRIVIVH